MNNVSSSSPQSKLKLFSIAGFSTSTIPFIIYGIWIYAFENTNSQPEAVEFFHSFFPSFLRGRYDTTYLGVLLLFLAIYFGTKAINITDKPWKVFNFTVLVLSGLLLCLNLFSLM